MILGRSWPIDNNIISSFELIGKIFMYFILSAHFIFFSLPIFANIVDFLLLKSKFFHRLAKCANGLCQCATNLIFKRVNFLAITNKGIPFLMCGRSAPVLASISYKNGTNPAAKNCLENKQK